MIHGRFMGSFATGLTINARATRLNLDLFCGVTEPDLGYHCWLTHGRAVSARASGFVLAGIPDKWFLFRKTGFRGDCAFGIRVYKAGRGIGIGRRSLAFPGTPPCVRVRTRRFGRIRRRVRSARMEVPSLRIPANYWPQITRITADGS